MSTWSSPRRVVFLSTIGVVVILVLINLYSWLSGLGCYNSLHVGMPEKEATAIMQQNGYTGIAMGCNHGEVTLDYSRNKLEPPIILGYKDGTLTYKERSCPPDYFLQSIEDRLRGHSR
jgi:hypothetical protein